MKDASAAGHQAGALDRFAMFLSATCMAHCLGTPLALSIAPVLSRSLLPESAFHWLVLGLVLPTSLWALTRGYRLHRRTAAVALGAIGLCVLAAAAGAGHEVIGETGERLATVLGSTIVAAAHVANHTLAKRNTRMTT